jgi:hypothetical protein
MLPDPYLQAVEMTASGLDEQLYLVGHLDLAFPTIERPNPGQRVDAGRQSRLDQSPPQALCAVAVGHRAENDDEIVFRHRLKDYPSLAELSIEDIANARVTAA